MKNTQNSEDIPARARTRKLTITTIRQIAKLVARGLTESEACRRLGIEPHAWFNFKTKAKNDSRFSAELETAQAADFDQNIQGIEAAGAGKGLKQPDWRARAWLLTVKAPKRFSDAAQRAQLDVNVSVTAPMDTRLLERALELATQGNPEAVARCLVNDVELRRRDRKTLEWLPCGFTPPKSDYISPAVRQIARKMLDQQGVIDVTPAEPKQITAGPGKDAG